VAAQIAQSLQVLSYDRRGHSQSSGDGSLDDDLADLAALIEHLHLAPVHLVGNSLGVASHSDWRWHGRSCCAASASTNHRC
jgi:pimeloyl-ACP methyl ester carboxylesterase